MKLPPIPDDEQQRVDELRSYGVLDTAAERAYDALVKIASEVTGRPIALISLVDSDRQWFKARVGLDAAQTGRDESFCAHMVGSQSPLVVTNALRDERFDDNPLVLGDPSIRFYAGAPLISPNQNVLGSLCVIDTEPGEISDAEVHILELLADQAVQLLEMRRIASQWRRDRHEARTFFEASLDLLCVASFDGFFTDLNQAWSRTLGYDLDTLKSRPFLEFIHPDDQASVMKETAALRTAGELRGFGVRFLTSSGEVRWLQFSATADEEFQRLIAVARDVTDARAKNEELAAARDAAEQASRSKSVFLANMSHELRTPLNSVIGFANVLLKNRDNNLNDKQSDYLERILRNGRQLLSLLNDVLDVSKIEVGQLEFVREPVDLVRTVGEVLATIDQDNRIRFEAPEGLEGVLADDRRLQQVITNLVGNALKFTSPEDEIAIEIRHQSLRPQHLSVVDTGIGIAPQNLTRIFEPFEQADSGTQRKFGGTGLGLAISRSLCESMGFALAATSELGEGSTFTVTFDRQAERIAPPLSKRTNTPTPAPSRHAPVLIIDDEPESRLLLESLVSDLGLPVVACDSPRLALRLAEAMRPRAVLLDLMMPDIDGFDVLRSFEQHPSLNDVPVVVVSIVGPDHWTRLAHAIEVLPKPTEKSDLARVLNSIVERPQRVLVVDDDPNARLLAVEALDDLHVEVVESTNGAEGLERLGESSFDAIVLDLTMPVLDGLEFLRRIRRDPRFQDIPVVVFSALNDQAVTLTDQVSAVVRKDGDTATLRAALERIL